MRLPVFLAFVPLLSALAACGGGATDARFPSREENCPVRSFPGAPTMPVEELGTVSVDCTGASCERHLLDEVCKRGGDVAWGLGDNALNASRLVAHAAHSRRATQGPLPKGCAVQLFEDKPPFKTENIGPVTAWCDQNDSREVCLRVLQDQVCEMGGDVLWQLDGPTPKGDKQRMYGRAAHTK